MNRSKSLLLITAVTVFLNGILENRSISSKEDKKMTVSSKFTFKNKQHSTWFFVPTALFGATGIAIGLAIGNLVGLI